MLETLNRILKRPDVHPEWSLIENCELVADFDGTLIVRLLTPQLHSDDFEKLVERLREGDLDAFQLVRFDFSRVKELVGCWSVHFALLIKLAEDVQAPVVVTGLTRQPAGVAWLFRSSPEVRSLLAVRPRENDASVDTGLRRVA